MTQNVCENCVTRNITPKTQEVQINDYEKINEIIDTLSQIQIEVRAIGEVIKEQLPKFEPNSEFQIEVRAIREELGLLKSGKKND